MEVQINVQDFKELKGLLRKIFLYSLKKADSKINNEIHPAFKGRSLDSGHRTINFNVKMSGQFMEVTCLEKKEVLFSAVFDSKELTVHT